MDTPGLPSPEYLNLTEVLLNLFWWDSLVDKPQPSRGNPILLCQFNFLLLFWCFRYCQYHIIYTLGVWGDRVMVFRMFPSYPPAPLPLFYSPDCGVWDVAFSLYWLVWRFGSIFVPYPVIKNAKPRCLLIGQVVARLQLARVGCSLSLALFLALFLPPTSVRCQS